MTDSQVRAIESLAETCQFGSGSRHAHKVATLASAIFDQLAARKLLQSLTTPERRTLIAASYVHDIGMSRAIGEGSAITSEAGPDSRSPGFGLQVFEAHSVDIRAADDFKKFLGEPPVDILLIKIVTAH